MSESDAAGLDAGASASSPGMDVAFLDRLRNCLQQRQTDGQSLALLLVDCGLIRRIDALWGYQVGDAVRARVVANLREQVLRPDDFVGEFGREDLACVLTVVAGPQIPQLAAEKALRVLRAPLWLGEDEIYALPAVGVAVFPGTCDSAETLLLQARAACTEAAGLPDRIALYEEAGVPRSESLIEEGRLRSAIAEDALELVFQPQFDLRFGQMMGVEAQLRWRGSGGRLVAMREAVAAAEAGGLITKMISALLNRALRNCSEFRQRAGLDLRVAINVPARAFLEPGLSDLVERALRTWSLRPGRLMIELDDIAVLEAHAQARDAVRHLDEIGVKLSIDDTRAQFSSLFWLASMPFQELKIDLSIARDWATQPRTERVLVSLIELAHHLKLDVIAVGVADEAAAAKLAQLGCNFMQADFKGAPVDAEEFVTRFGDL